MAIEGSTRPWAIYNRPYSDVSCGLQVIAALHAIVLGDSIVLEYSIVFDYTLCEFISDATMINGSRELYSRPVGG